MELIHIIYASTPKEDFTESCILQMLPAIRENNHRLNVTGMLLYTGNSFLQVLEGESTVVQNIYTVINSDSRHQDITLIIKEPIFKRDFQDWSMGFSSISAEHSTSIPGLNDFFLSGTSLTKLDMGRAKKILQAFTKGLWQNSIVNT
jgi:hypothetical protein